MALWDIIKAVGDIALTQAQNKTKEALTQAQDKTMELLDSKEDWADKYSLMSDEKLLREYKKVCERGINSVHGNTVEKIIKINELKKECEIRGLI